MDELHSSKSPTEDDFESTLHSAPSFAIYNDPHGDDDIKLEEVLKRIALTGLSLESTGSGEFSFGKSKMDLIEEGERENENDWSAGIQNLTIEEEEVEPASPPMYLAAGLGVDETGFDGEIGSDERISDDMFNNPNLQESEDLEAYHKRMVDEYPCHPLILKKYAQLLQSNGDLQGAEEYFLRATLADPNDGEILMQYGKLVWENHLDKDRALVYFERAVQAAPQDSHVLAAYASFLWKIEDDESEDGKHEIQSDKEKQKTEPGKLSKEENDPISQFSILADGQVIDPAYITATDCGEESNVEDYFKKMIDKYPNNPLFLKKYAQFLLQSKRDLKAAEDYYSRAIVADPSDGEMISEYAKLVWELHHDQEKASFLFEQAVQATPGDRYNFGDTSLRIYKMFCYFTCI
ncbi:uroporphyrinogen-III synthase [Spatholobus suberectus]|nr:uroporphyrinogen-III synthase [Spatholobus suberectus]